MSTLVAIPWQPHLFLTPSTLGYLQRASAIIGRTLWLYDAEYTRISPAWRSYAQQKAAWLNSQHGGPTASNPDTGNRYHMRGAAFDLRDTSASVQLACRAAGLIRDTVETWHWNDPNWRNMPIISTNTSAAGGDATLITRKRIPNMLIFCDVNARPFLYALAGTSPGTAANWLETTNEILARSWTAITGSRSDLVSADYQAMKAKYLEPVRVKS